ncbi:unnamed protein product [Colias eurytheme]|nr:unnamed protein product [Colias eurytheme]
MTWSKELAEFAQRWADQCDSAIRPDREDECRDLETDKVGQNIATITGASKGISLKNFIDMWFIQSMAYTGSVTYYNMSINSKSNYFTQLIWATTKLVGCGRARFYINLQPIDRLVCNFSPGGNVQKRPIYIIGYPGTQCEEGMAADKQFPGLCTDTKKADITDPPSSTSLLRIIYSVTSEIDPIKNNFNTIKENDAQRNRAQKLRHVYNNSYALKRDNRNYRGTPPNASRHPDGFFQHRERGHSRVYHGHDHTLQMDYLHPEQNNKNFRRYDYTTTSSYELTDEFYRRHNNDNIGNRKCTRKSETSNLNDCVTTSCLPVVPIKQCTRGQRNICDPGKQGCQLTTHSCDNTSPQCQCSTLKVTCATNPNYCPQNNNCKCPNVDTAGNLCSDMRRNLNVQREEITTNGFYDDYEGMRSKAELKAERLKPLSKIDYDDSSWKLNLNRQKKSTHRIRTPHQSRDRVRREPDDQMTFKPFWQVDEYNKQPQLKSLRYTTLANKKTRRRRPMTPSTQKIKLVTEPITIAIKATYKNPTEKYLSFDELLRLRKLNASEYNARRSDDASTVAPVTEESSTTEYTANTPFVRLKHCTRKLTCTWTAASLGENEGNADIGNRGSRTPPGYVEGCTRTSTCTRDYMHRNKMDTLPTPSTEPEVEEGNDEDYCEKRSLNVRRRDSNQELVSQSTEFPLTKTLIEAVESDTEQHEYRNLQKEKDESDFDYCSCDDYLRNKRESDLKSSMYGGKSERMIKRDTESYNTLSYGDLFYLVLRKIIERWNRNKITVHGKCLCNACSRTTYNIGLQLMMLFIYF